MQIPHLLSLPNWCFFPRHHFWGQSVLASRNVGCFLRLSGGWTLLCLYTSLVDVTSVENKQQQLVGHFVLFTYIDTRQRILFDIRWCHFIVGSRCCWSSRKAKDNNRISDSHYAGTAGVRRKSWACNWRMYPLYIQVALYFSSLGYWVFIDLNANFVGFFVVEAVQVVPLNH